MQRLVIVGGGTAGWMAANLLIKQLGDQVKVSLVESPDIGIVGVGEGSTPTLKRFFELIEVAETDWMPACQATYKTNIRFSGWSPKSGRDSYSHPFISQVDTFTERAFHVNCRTRRLGLDTNTNPGDFLINGVLAQLGKAPIVPEHFPFRMEYGYHFDSYLVGQYLAKVAASRGVNHIQANVTGVKTHPDGSISSLITDTGDIDADWFIDCTGFKGLLISETLNVPFRSFKENLFNDAAVVIPTPAQDVMPVETHAVALEAGWCWHIPLRHRTGNGYVYSQDFISPEHAEKTLRQHLGVTDDTEARHLKMRVGQLERHWQKNVIALGLSQGFIEPLEATALHLVQVATELFISLWQKGNYTQQYQDEYNVKVTERFERVRDYIVAHYKLNSRDDSEYWRANRDNDNLSKSLISLINCWFERRDLNEEIHRQNLETHFGETSWHCLFAGYGAFPKLADNQPNQGDLYKEQNVADFLNRCALNFNSHQSQLVE